MPRNKNLEEEQGRCMCMGGLACITQNLAGYKSACRELLRECLSAMCSPPLHSLYSLPTSSHFYPSCSLPTLFHWLTATTPFFVGRGELPREIQGTELEFENAKTLTLISQKIYKHKNYLKWYHNYWASRTAKTPHNWHNINQPRNSNHFMYYTSHSFYWKLQKAI